MKLKLRFGLFFLLGSLTCFGQINKLKFGLSSSLDFNSYSFVDYDPFEEILTYKGVTSYSAGIILRQEISRKIFIKSGLYYSSKTFSETIHPDQFDTDPLIISGDFKIIHSSK